MGKFFRWFRTPKATPLQLFILFFGIFYYVYFATDLFEGLPELLQVAIYGFMILLSIIAGASWVDSKRLAWALKKIARRKDLSDTEKMNEILYILDEALYNLDRKVEEKKKEGKK